MIYAFENLAHQNPMRTFFTSVDKQGDRTIYSYREVRLYASTLAKRLRDKGVRRGDSVTVDLPNVSAFVCLLLAAAYGGYTLVLLNNRLNAAEKLKRVMEVERDPNIRVKYRVDESNLAALMEDVESYLGGELHRVRSNAAQVAKTERTQRTSFVTRTRVETADVRTSKALGRAARGRDTLVRREEMARQDALEDAINFADHAKHTFDPKANAIVMFTSGTTGRSKAVPLTWGNLTKSAEAANASFAKRGDGLWQAALPLYHIGGLQIIVRSILNAVPFILYEKFDADQILADAARHNATHVSVVDKMLQDMCASERNAVLQRYSCIALGGGAPNMNTLEEAWKLHANVYLTYGMTETSSMIANIPLDYNYRGGLKLLPGYQAHIVGAGDSGFGSLAVKGPGVFEGYLGSRDARTADGFFMTGDIGAIHNGLLYIKERTDDMFVSGGENIYPEEIRQRLLRMPGVAEVCVVGAPDEAWGRRPVAFVERKPQRLTEDAAREASKESWLMRMPDDQFLVEMNQFAVQNLSRLNQPKRIYVLARLPRLASGKVDRQTLLSMHQQKETPM